MTSDDAGGLTVDLKLFKQLIKKKRCGKPNRLQIAINALREPAERELSCLVSKCTPAGVSL